jgi:hypothetical protein
VLARVRASCLSTGARSTPSLIQIDAHGVARLKYSSFSSRRESFGPRKGISWAFYMLLSVDSWEDQTDKRSKTMRRAIVYVDPSCCALLAIKESRQPWARDQSYIIGRRPETRLLEWVSGSKRSRRIRCLKWCFSHWRYRGLC